MLKPALQGLGWGNVDRSSKQGALWVLKPMLGPEEGERLECRETRESSVDLSHPKVGPVLAAEPLAFMAQVRGFERSTGPGVQKPGL